MTSSAVWSRSPPGYKHCSLSTSASGTPLWYLKYFEYFQIFQIFFIYFGKPERFSEWSSTTAEFSCSEYWIHRRHFCPFSISVIVIWDLKIFSRNWPYLWETCCSCWCSWWPCWWRRPRPCWSGRRSATPGRRCWSPFGKCTAGIYDLGTILGGVFLSWGRPIIDPFCAWKPPIIMQ